MGQLLREDGKATRSCTLQGRDRSPANMDEGTAIASEAIQLQHRRQTSHSPILNHTIKLVIILQLGRTQEHGLLHNKAALNSDQARIRVLSEVLVPPQITLRKKIEEEPLDRRQSITIRSTEA